MSLDREKKAAAMQFVKVRHNFGDREVLKGVDLAVGEGEFFGLLGPSGAGKTTLIKIVTGQLAPMAGNAYMVGQDASKLSGQDYTKVGIMMDSLGLYERFSCYDNLKFYAKLHGVETERIILALERVGLGDARKTAAANLSKGMRNRLLLARAILTSPKVLFLDEPTSGLDPATMEDIHRLLLEEKKRGTTIFLTTHNMTEAEKLCDNIALLNEGKIVEYGNPKEICRKYNHQKQLRLHLYDGSELEIPHDESALEQLAEYMRNGQLETIHSTEPDLESVFMELTGRRFE